MREQQQQQLLLQQPQHHFGLPQQLLPPQQLQQQQLQQQQQHHFVLPQQQQLHLQQQQPVFVKQEEGHDRTFIDQEPLSAVPPHMLRPRRSSNDMLRGAIYTQEQPQTVADAAPAQAEESVGGVEGAEGLHHEAAMLRLPLQEQQQQIIDTAEERQTLGLTALSPALVGNNIDPGAESLHAAIMDPVLEKLRKVAPRTRRLGMAPLPQLKDDDPCPSPDSDSLILSINGVKLKIDGPGPEVRTRTPSEQRTFSLTIELRGNVEALYELHGAKSLALVADLCFAPSPSDLVHMTQGAATHRSLDDLPVQLVPNGQNILTGTTSQRIDGSTSVVNFSDLAVSESSTKHGEREFCVRVSLMADSSQSSSSGAAGSKRRRSDSNGQSSLVPVAVAMSRSFYAFSHGKVLRRRSNVSLRSLSRDSGRMGGGDQLHLIGGPFIKGPSLQISFVTKTGSTAVCPASDIEFFSESVLFFTLPACPGNTEGMNQIPALVYVSNDGRTLSGACNFVFVTGRVGEAERHFS